MGRRMHYIGLHTFCQRERPAGRGRYRKRERRKEGGEKEVCNFVNIL